jgi:FkbM family methyltransferase
MHARADTPNELRSNGERMIQQSILGVKNKKVIFDVGANIGKWTIMLLDLCERENITPNMEIHAFEPIPSSFALLGDASASHPLHGQVKLVPVALSNEKGCGEMYEFERCGETNSLYFHSFLNNTSVHKVSVVKNTIQSYCVEQGIDKIDLIKIDAEGHDMDIILGACDLIERESLSATVRV